MSAQPKRVRPADVPKRLRTNGSLLVCAYPKEKYDAVKLEGSISFEEFQSREGGLRKDVEVIFYCA